MHDHPAEIVLTVFCTLIRFVMQFVLEIVIKGLRFRLYGIFIGSLFFLLNLERFKWIIKNRGTRQSWVVFVDFFDDFWQL